MNAQVVMPPSFRASDQLGPLQATLALAACAIRKDVQAIRADPEFVEKALAAYPSMMGADFWKTVENAPGFHPFRDCAGLLSSWRGTNLELADFGGGRPWAVAGTTLPWVHKLMFMTTGPGGDGALAITGFTDPEWQQLQSSRILAQLVPEARFLQPPSTC